MRPDHRRPSARLPSHIVDFKAGRNCDKGQCVSSDRDAIVDLLRLASQETQPGTASSRHIRQGVGHPASQSIGSSSNIPPSSTNAMLGDPKRTAPHPPSGTPVRLPGNVPQQGIQQRTDWSEIHKAIKDDDEELKHKGLDDFLKGR